MVLEFLQLNLITFIDSYTILFQTETISSNTDTWQSVISVIAPVTSVGSLIALYRFFKLERRESDDAVSKAQDIFFTRLDQRDRAFLESLHRINESLASHNRSIAELSSTISKEIESLRQQQERTSFFLLAIARTGTQPWTEESISKTLRMIREERI